MNLQKLPSEVLLLIGKQSETESDIFALMRTHTRFYQIFLPLLYKYNVDYSSSSALLWCIKHCNEIGASLLLEWNARHTRAHLPHTWDDYGGPLHLVTDHNIAKLLLDHGADVNDLSDLGETPFHVAARNGRLDVAKLLLDHGAHINAHGYEIIDTFDVRATPLRYALKALGNHFLMAKLLLDRGADHNLADSEEGTALHVAARLGCEKSTKLLLDHGAPLDVQDDTGWTALHIASYLGHSAVAKVLVNCGAYLNILDRQGNSPTDLAVRNGYFQTMMLVLARYEAN